MTETSLAEKYDISGDLLVPEKGAVRAITCFDAAANDPVHALSDQEWHDSYVAFLDHLDKTVFGIHGSLEDYGVGLKVHQDIQEKYDANPAGYRSILYRINQSRDLFSLSPLIAQTMQVDAPTPRLQ